MNNNLNRIPFLLALSRKTTTVVRQNVAFGVVFIVVGEALAASHLIGLILAAVLHLVSGLVVIFNSARLVRCGEDIEQADAEQLERAAHGHTPEPMMTPSDAQPAPA